jgi:cytochrome c peroxidase/serine/threonine protein kinase
MSEEPQPQASDQDPLGIVGLVIDKRYEVRELVDEGGFGYVYRAHHVMWDKPVAMKFFKRLSGGKTRDTMKVAFIKEGALMSELSRKTTSIVQSRDVGEYAMSEDVVLLYTVLEWLDGRTLDKLLKEERRAGASMWPLHRVLRTMAPVAEALDVAHTNSVAHRDIKPSNVFIANEEGKDVVKVLDFGIAKVVEGMADGFAETGAHKNAAYTPAYAAPEQIARRHGSTGPWTDVYALALVCVELLVGRHPIRADNFGQLVFATCDVDKRPTPRSCGCELGEDVEGVFRRALSVTAKERYASVREFWDALVHTQLGQHALEELQSEGESHTLPPFLGATLSGERARSQVPPAPKPASPLAASPKPLAVALGGLALVAAGGYWLLNGPSQDGAVPVATSTATAEPALPTTNPVQLPPKKLAGIDKERLASFSTLPAVVNDAANPVTKKKTDLGRRLFYEKRLSRNGDLSCNSCHRLADYGADKLPVSVGNGGKKGRRNALSVYHAAGAFALMWDGRSKSVEEQASMPLTNPDEMAMSQVAVVKVLRGIPQYVTAFREAFPVDGSVNMSNVARALGAFERKLFTPAPWDDFLRGDKSALSEQQQRGFNAFVNVGCVTCHFGPYIGLSMYQKLGLIKAWPDSKDRGRYELTKNDADRMVFRVPGLRNVAKTGPYFHDGSEASLERAVHRMAVHQLGRTLSSNQAKDIVSWLGSLTGRIPSDYIRPPEPF